MIKKFMISWNPCMSRSVDPIAVPSAANTIAMSAMNRNACGIAAKPCGLKPAIRHTASTSAP